MWRSSPARGAAAATAAEAAPEARAAKRPAKGAAQKRRDVKHLAALSADARVLLQRGHQRRKLGKHNLAIDDFNAVLKSAPRCVPALAGRAGAKRSLGEVEAALADYSSAAALDPKDVNLQAAAGFAKLDLGWYRRARADFEAALRLDATSRPAIRGKRAALRLLRDGPLRVVTLRGFKRPRMNADFVERRRSPYVVNDSETYWSADGACLLYWCGKERRWKGCRADDFAKVQAGGAVCFIGAASRKHVLSASLLKGWHEWDGAEWAFQPQAGVCCVGPLTPPLRTVTLAGFTRRGMNTTYFERRQRPYQVGGRETFWSTCEKYFVYWCGKESRWKATSASHLEKVQGGKSSCFMSAPAGADILAGGPPRGWHEWTEKDWVLRKDAGVAKSGPSPLELRTVKLGGFLREGLNATFEERRAAAFLVNGREIFMSVDGTHFLFWCVKESRWKGSDTRHLAGAKAGESKSFAGAPLGADILAPTPLVGWHEWTKTGWAYRPAAGVAALGCSPTTLSAAAPPRAGDTTPKASTRAKDARKLQPPPVISQPL